jgi:hypothetical protein
MKKTPTLLALALGLALSMPALAGPGNGNGNGPPDRGAPDRGRPDNGNGGDRGGPPATPPGRGDDPPPGHGGPNPGNGGNNGQGHGRVSRGDTRVCGDDATVVGPLGQAGDSHVAHITFSPAAGSDSGAWARMMYFWIGTTFDFVLNAHQVEPGSAWTLVARAEDGSGICLADGVANPGGELHLRDSLELDSHLPDGLDPFEPTPEGEAPAGAALQLVPSDAADCEAGSVAEGADNLLLSDAEVRFVDVDEVSCPE